ncbi:MAG: cell division protein FtsZ [Bacteroidetes bacterium GWA2_30_7]|nr:MAG: cell division protein FtsZ [Bacteroidetes bacterium GWA2_30_7]
MNDDLMNFDIPQNKHSIIKIIGVGGGGGNAVNYMFAQGIKDVDFVICNTDSQALLKSPIPIKIQLGQTLTQGLGAGNLPEKGRQSAIETLDDISEVLNSNTKMVFITAGMGGGTGTGAAPVIAQAAKELGILTVGIVTIPFRNEGPRRINQAIEGIAALKEHVDSLLVINNERLREIYGNLKLSEAFSKADEILTTAAKGIAEIITVPGYINVDFADVQTVMKESGVAVMGSGISEGEDRAIKAIELALNSPLLNNNDIRGARNILLNITSGIEEITMDEVGIITDYVQEVAGSNTDIIWGNGIDETLGNRINVTIIATGFGTSSIPEFSNRCEKPKQIFNLNENKKSKTADADESAENKQVFSLDDDVNIEKINTSKPTAISQISIPFDANENKDASKNKEIEEYYGKSNKADETENTSTENPKNDISKNYEKLRQLSHLTNKNIDELESEPAFKRQQLNIETKNVSQEQQFSKYYLSEDENKNVNFKENNSYLHDNVD